jgi:hypothetical protein
MLTQLFLAGPVPPPGRPDPRLFGAAGPLVAGLARVPQLRLGARRLRRAIPGRLLEYEQGLLLRLLVPAVGKRDAGKV